MMKKSDKNKTPPICDLNLEKYLGKWYEIGKLPARGQNGLDNVTAIYTLKDNGKIAVNNVGYKKGKKRAIKGSAWLRDAACKGGLYVRFFWPFKSEYNVIKIAIDYRYAVVMGDDKSKLWILSRTPKIKRKDYKEITKYLEEEGFETKNILKTKQKRKV